MFPSLAIRQLRCQVTGLRFDVQALFIYLFIYLFGLLNLQHLWVAGAVSKDLRSPVVNSNQRTSKTSFLSSFSSTSVLWAAGTIGGGSGGSVLGSISDLVRGLDETLSPLGHFLWVQNEVLV